MCKGNRFWIIVCITRTVAHAMREQCLSMSKYYAIKFNMVI
jgi:hypothetical protein